MGIFFIKHLSALYLSDNKAVFLMFWILAKLTLQQMQ